MKKLQYLLFVFIFISCIVKNKEDIIKDLKNFKMGGITGANDSSDFKSKLC